MNCDGVCWIHKDFEKIQSEKEFLSKRDLKLILKRMRSLRESK